MDSVAMMFLGAVFGSLCSFTFMRDFNLPRLQYGLVLLGLQLGGILCTLLSKY